MPTAFNPGPAGTASNSNLSGRIPELDGIRGIAIAMVLIDHYFLVGFHPRIGSPLAYLFALGRLAGTGVDLFFVLSGFLIGGILIDARNSTNYFQVFYIRRFFRIVPIYALFLILNFSFFALIHSGRATSFSWVLRSELPWYSYPLFLQNFWMIARNTLGALTMGITWSLAIEEQFYLTLPLIVRKVVPSRLLYVVIGGILCAPLLRIAIEFLWHRPASAWFVLMPCRADALLLGVLGAIVMRRDACRAWLELHGSLLRMILLILVAGAGLLTYMFSKPSYNLIMLTGGYTWLAGLYLCFILYGLTQKQSLVNKLLNVAWLRWLGIIAYGVYLFHLFILVFVSHPFWPNPLSIRRFSDLWVAFPCLIVTLLFCRISWLYFEKPLVKVGHRASYQFDSSAGAPPSVLEGGSL